MDDLPYKDEKVGCVCFRIPYDNLIRIIKEHKPKSANDVSMICPAGRGCGMCRPYIDYYIQKESQNDNGNIP
jgi:NAD(P)H-nitrite reductase large subunit